LVIDLHFHTKKYSKCSEIELEEGIKKAKEIGIDAICITEHDVFPIYNNLRELENKYNMKIFLGMEVFTNDGDILCFGLDEIKNNDISALELVNHIYDIGGASIAAHPYRNNGRGIKDKILKIKKLTAIESYNGNTCDYNNKKAYDVSFKHKLKIIGSSDAHFLGKIGCYATEFENEINSVEELIKELKYGVYRPVKYNRETNSFTSIKCN
jgi:predicted metal-dependent phosphoesterase TrpH